MKNKFQEVNYAGAVGGGRISREMEIISCVTWNCSRGDLLDDLRIPKSCCNSGSGEPALYLQQGGGEGWRNMMAYRSNTHNIRVE